MRIAAARRGKGGNDAAVRLLKRCRFVLVPLLAMIAGGCGPKSAAFQAYMQPELAYLRDQPYTRLYVEVDVMEGVEVPAEWLDELEAFLARYCRKPDGITVVRDEPVPASAVVDLPMGLVTVLCTDGPPVDDTGRPAYLHVVFYDSNKWPRQQARPPHVYGTCPTAIVCDIDSVFRTFGGQAAGSVLKHEAGHVLGLSRSPEHGDGVHCRNPGCLMRPTPGIGTQIGLLFRVPWKGRLCDACEHDLEASLSHASPENLSFLGPFLVRHEDEYDVIRLPNYDMLAIGPMEKAYDWQTMLARAKETIRRGFAEGTARQTVTRGRFKGMGTWRTMAPSAGNAPGTDRFRAILARAAQDPCPQIRKYAQRLLSQSAGEEAEKGRFP